jgi:hypothetical protein
MNKIKIYLIILLSFSNVVFGMNEILSQQETEQEKGVSDPEELQVETPIGFGSSAPNQDVIEELTPVSPRPLFQNPEYRQPYNDLQKLDNDDTPYENPGYQTPYTASHHQDTPTPTSSKWKWKWKGIGVLGLVVVLISGGFYLLFKKKDDDILDEKIQYYQLNP